MAYRVSKGGMSEAADRRRLRSWDYSLGGGGAPAKKESFSYNVSDQWSICTCKNQPTNPSVGGLLGLWAAVHAT